MPPEIFEARAVRPTSWYARCGKPILDWALTVVALPVVLPVGALLVVLIRLDSPGPALIRVRRLGKGHSSFLKFKFRTMVVDAEVRLQQILATDPELRREYEATYKLKKDPRVTRFGRLLRKSSLDELPQILNVIRSEMSWVGPRDILPSELHKYGDSGDEFVSVRPGITGLWQVSGRSQLPYEERVRLDLFYIAHQSVGLDFRILLRTVPVVLFGWGAA